MCTFRAPELHCRIPGQDGGFAKVLKQQTGQPFTSFGLNVAGRSEGITCCWLSHGFGDSTNQTHRMENIIIIIIHYPRSGNSF